MKLLLPNPECSNYQCDACVYNNLCMMGCFGSQYENTGELFNPPKNMCAMLKCKIDTLISKYKELGIIDYYKDMYLERRSDIEKRREILSAIDKIDKYNEECKDG